MIREARIEDMAELLALYHAVEKTPTQDGEHTAVLFEKLVKDPNYHILVAEEEGMVVSSCSCIVVENLTAGQRPYALVENVATLPSWQRRGLASACMHRAKEIAAANGCYKIYLTTSSKARVYSGFMSGLGTTEKKKQRLFNGFEYAIHLYNGVFAEYNLTEK